MQDAKSAAYEPQVQAHGTRWRHLLEPVQIEATEHFMVFGKLRRPTARRILLQVHADSTGLPPALGRPTLRWAGAVANGRRALYRRLLGAGLGSSCACAGGNGHDFKCGRQFAAWLGLVPSQYSSGGKARLGHITKAGDPYMRMQLVLGARSVLNPAKSRDRIVILTVDTLFPVEALD
jgi:transposase